MAKTKMDQSKEPSIRERILIEAMHLIASKGYEATSIQTVADAVGIRKQSLLYHFPNKENLRACVIEQLVSRWNDLLPKVMLAATSSRGRFEAVMRTVVEFFAEDPDRARLLLREALDRPEEMRRIMMLHSQVWSAAIRDYIQDGQELGSVDRNLDPEAYILHILTLILSGLATFSSMSAVLEQGASSHNQKSELDRYVDEMMRIAQASLFTKRLNDGSRETEQSSNRPLNNK